MVKFERFTLDNGLRVIFHQDETTPMAVVNTLYDVGARDENPDKTGFAHLFEHLMFGGSVNIPDFDAPLQRAGGESNAFTSNDITNYYDVLPAYNIETALWLESDRMLSLAFTPKSLETQRSVVIEEFKQRYLNQPYGDVWLKLRPLAYKTHPYLWATIGKEIKHIEDATMEDVRAFFDRYYCPANAILCIAGDFDLQEVKDYVNKWYGDIPSGIKHGRNLPVEAEQIEFREETIARDVPSDAFYYAFRMPERKSPDYQAADVISDALGGDKSSRLYNVIQKKLKLVTEIQAYVMGSLDEGLFLISGKLAPEKTFAELDNALWTELEKIKTEPVTAKELERLKNKIQTAREFQDQGLLNRAMNLSFYELLGDANGINLEMDIYAMITVGDLQRVSTRLFRKENCTLLKVKSTLHA
ncbi:MAG: peptidase domain protein [Crocinitomicaceae bacterium]|jgi:predicted Zn-dependent peptidase|nr:peptidase domain protein [Crocinitomicaceae bacterium]